MAGTRRLSETLGDRNDGTERNRLQCTAGDTPQLPEPTVRVAQGLVRGRRAVSKQGGSYLSFQGLPYAEPPVGPLRFKPPQPPQPWGGELAALQPPPIPPQNEGGAIKGSEDCLYLNVYTPQIKAGARLPVMVWIFGGGFVTGSANPDLYGPDYLVDAGVVLVTLNYRLGVLGFLSLGNADAAGNMGLKDQVAALRWVRENIGAFGGDRDNVTIFGESAGGVSVSYHMLSPMSKGLFHKAIAQSGSVLNPWAFTRASRQYAFRLGELLGCRTEDERQLMDRLMAADADTLVKHAERVLPRTENNTGMKILFVPSAEPEVEGQEAFITKEPKVLLEEGKFHRVPYMSGVVTHEGAVSLRSVLKYPGMLEKLNEEFAMALPLRYRCLLNKKDLEEVSMNAKSLYFKNKPLSRDNLIHLSHFYTDVNLASGIYIAAKQISASSTAPVFFYNFSFDGDLGWAKKVMVPLGANFPGPYHGDDIGYLFRLGLYDPNLSLDSPEVKMRNLMVKLWTNFARTGNPTPDVDAGIPVSWSSFDPLHENFMRIDRNLGMDRQLWKNRMSFWQDIHDSKL